jgi:ribonuclease-3
MSELVVVFRTASGIEASVVRGLLEAHGLRPLLVSSDGLRGVMPMTTALGELMLEVPEAEADEARHVIHDYCATQEGGRVVEIVDDVGKLESAIGHRFRDRGLLEDALTHRSHAQEDVTGGARDNESLEFLGDAILGFVVADLLFHEFPDYDEGQKSKIKAALVSAPMLARVGDRLRLGEHLLLGRGEEKTGGRRKQALIADTCEAIIAAVYLDGGLEAARAFVAREVQPLVERARRPGLLTALTGDYKSALQEWLQARNDAPPEYRLTREEGPAHRRRFTVDVCVAGEVMATADGHSKKEAEQQAARTALMRLGVDVQE